MTNRNKRLIWLTVGLREKLSRETFEMGVNVFSISLAGIKIKTGYDSQKYTTVPMIAGYPLPSLPNISWCISSRV